MFLEALDSFLALVESNANSILLGKETLLRVVP